MIWAKERTPAADVTGAREFVLPTGVMHIAIRLSDDPLRLFDSSTDTVGYRVGSGVLCGVRTGAFCKEVDDPAPSVGAVLRPGACELLSRTPAVALSARHVLLEDLWRPALLSEIRDRLDALPSLERRLDLFEDALERRLPDLPGIDPMIAYMLFRFGAGLSVAEAARETGYSERHAVRRFTEAVGVPPKAHLRLKRFNQTIARLQSNPHVTLADVAAQFGYADQSHMTREFQDFAGMTPRRYLRGRTGSAHHVVLID